MATDLWAGLDWPAFPVMMYGFPSNRETMSPLMEAAWDHIGTDLWTLCQQDLCVIGLFALQLMVISGMLADGALVPKEVRPLLETNMDRFVDVLKDHLSGAETNMFSDFGNHVPASDRSLPDVTLQLLGRTLYQMSELPPPPGPKEGQFAFGRNWQQFVERGLSAGQVVSSVKEVRSLLGSAGAFTASPELHGLKVLDLGCGSGLSSLAFHLQGAEVISVDVQEESLEATRTLRGRFGEEASWLIQKVSALDSWALANLAPVDIVYTWGVLHHTGDVWQAIHNAQLPMAEDGLLLVAVYAEEFFDEKQQILEMKEYYHNASVRQQEHLDIATGIYWLRPLLRAGVNPFDIMTNFTDMRGMDFWTDVRDWLGGWPMEFVSATNMFSFVHRAGLRCVGVRRNGGNTEFALTRPAGVARWTAGRRCVELETPKQDDRENFLADFSILQRRLYYWGDRVNTRHWWSSPLPGWMHEHSDGADNPQKNRLLMITVSGEPFGYPSAQFARPDAVNDPQLAFHAFWDGFAYVSPAQPSPEALQPPPLGLRVCLLPPAELSALQEAEILAHSQAAGL